MNRRQFSKLTALTVASTSLPLGAQAQQPVRFAAVGLGTISDIFIRACAQSTKCKITGLVSGHADQKAPKYRQMYGIPPRSVYTYENFDQIAHNPDIDAVYIGLPNSMHAEYTIRAAKAGKHVLCEKPMAISSAECRQMINACRQANVKLMIAYRVHYDPFWIQIRDMIHSGAIGQVQGYQGGFYASMPDGWRLDPKLAGGGSLFDLGIYPINTIRWLRGEEPIAYVGQIGTASSNPRYVPGMEESVNFSLKFPSGILASGGSSYGETGGAYVNIDGTAGSLQVESAFFYEGLRVRGKTKSGPVDQTSPGKAPYQFTAEADYFADCIHTNTQPATAGEEGLKDLLAIESIYQAAGAPVA